MHVSYPQPLPFISPSDVPSPPMGPVAVLGLCVPSPCTLLHVMGPKLPGPPPVGSYGQVRTQGCEDRELGCAPPPVGSIWQVRTQESEDRELE